MFTGIVQGTGRVESFEPEKGEAQISILPKFEFAGIAAGESIAVEGVCLTAEAGSSNERLRFFLSSETIVRTTLGGVRPDSTVNLERSLSAGSPIGGHLVMGHVDGVGEILRLDREGDGRRLEIQCAESMLPYLAPKGSVAVDGISLTIVDVKPRGFTAAIIPYTYEDTSLRAKAAGSKVNLEADVLARYVVQYLRRTFG